MRAAERSLFVVVVYAGAPSWESNESCGLWATKLSFHLKQAQRYDESIQVIMEILKIWPYQDFKIKGGLLF